MAENPTKTESDMKKTKKPLVVAVDDEKTNLRFMMQNLGETCDVRPARSGSEAITRINGLMEQASSRVDLVLLDIKMLGMDGFEVCQKLKADSQTKDIPVIFVTGMDDPESEVKGLELGAVDFVTKPLNPALLRARVNNVLKSEERKCRLEELAHFDTVTGLPNRARFMEDLNSRFEISKAERKNMAVLFIDLDRFKWVNDTLGHGAGDKTLCEAGKRIREILRKSDIVARIGGDEFAVILPEIENPEQAGIVARKIVKEMARPFNFEEGEANIGASIGISLFPENADSPDELMTNADTASKGAKEEGRGSAMFFSEEMQEDNSRKQELIKHLDGAIERNEFSLYWQPQVRDGELSGSEVLLRWDSEAIGSVSPVEFIPIAEETGQIVYPLGHWIMETAFRQWIGWIEEGHSPFVLSVNVSYRQLREKGFDDKVFELLEKTGMDKYIKYLELEVTETATEGRGADVVNSTLEKLEERGIKLAIDDMGTGQSGLRRLGKLPFKIIKIDMSFVTDLISENEKTQEDARAIIAGIFATASEMKIRNAEVVAEGVETKVQENILKELNTHNVPLRIQGWLYGKAIPANEFRESFLNK